MAIEIVDLPIKNGGSFHSYVNVYHKNYSCRYQKKHSYWSYKPHIPEGIIAIWFLSWFIGPSNYSFKYHNSIPYSFIIPSGNLT